MKLVTLTQGKPFNEICTEIDRLIGNDYQRVKIGKQQRHQLTQACVEQVL